MNVIVNKIFCNAKKYIRANATKNADPVRWGILGLGYMAECFSSSIDGNKNGIVVAAASRSLEKAKKFSMKHGNCKAYGSYEAMINDASNTLDIIYIATPTKFHYENIKLCLQAGKNVLCEKPITMNMKELEELQKLAEEKKCFLMEGMWMKCLPTYQKALLWVEEGRIGSIELIKADFYKREIRDSANIILNQEKGGGVLRDFGVYAVAFPTGFLRGMPDELSSYSRESNNDIDVDWMIRMRFGETQVFLNISSDFGGTSKAAVMGSKGTIEWDSQFNRTNIIRLYDMSGNQVEQYESSYEYDGFEYEVNEAQMCIKKGLKESKVVSLDSSMKTLMIIDRLLKK